MPTRIDVAAKAAHKEIDEIKNNIKSSLSTVGGGGSNPNLNEEQQQPISPLFRDEVQHQEMQYLDGLLMEENKKSSEKVYGKKKSEPSPALQQQSEVQYQSKLASILKPYDYKDDDEKKKLKPLDDKKSCSASHNGIRQSQNNNSDKYFRVGACSTNSKSTTTSNQQKTIRNKVRGTLSNLIHRNSQPNKKNKQRQYGNINNKKKSYRTTTANPSRNKRRSQLLNFKGTQRRIITKMIKLGRKCTRHFTSIKHSIENVVVQAIHKTHSMLEQHQHSSSNGVVDLSQRTMGSARRYGDKKRDMVDSKGKGSSASH